MICNCQHHLVTETCLVLHIQGAATLIYQFSCSRVHYPLSQYVRHCTCAVTSGMKTPPIQLIQCVFAVAPVSHRSCMSARLWSVKLHVRQFLNEHRYALVSQIDTQSTPVSLCPVAAAAPAVELLSSKHDDARTVCTTWTCWQTHDWSAATWPSVGQFASSWSSVLGTVCSSR